MADIFGSFNQGFTAGRQIRDDRMKRNALLQAGEAYKTGDYRGASNALFAQDPGAAMQIDTYGRNIEAKQQADQLAGQERDQQRAQATLKAFGQMAQALKPLPLEARLPAARQYVQRLAPTLGMDADQLLSMMNPDDFTDTNIDSTIALSMDPEGYAKLQQQLAAPQKLGLGDILTDARGTVLQRNPRPVQAVAAGNGGATSAPAQSAGGPTPMPEYGPNAFKLANGSIVEIYRDKQGQPRIGKTLVTGPGGGNPDTVKTILTQRAGRQSLLLQDIGRAKKLAEKGTTGLGSMLSGFPGTSSKDLAALLETIKSNIGFAELQAMRDSSPTGGALGQVTERELSLLQAVVGSLDQAQSREQFTANLDRLERQYQQSMAAIAAAYERDFGQPLDLGSGLPAPPMPGGGAPVEDPFGIR